MRSAGAATAIVWLALAPALALAQTTTAPDAAPAAAGDQTAPATPAQTPPTAPDASPLQMPSPILTLDQDRMFTELKFGQRVTRQYEDAARALATENRKIEADLTAEERDLTERRAKLSPEEFRKLADAFDTKVEAIRKSQGEKNAALVQTRDAERQKFLQDVLPILGGLVRESGAVAILNSQAIFLSFKGIDVTDRAIARIDAKIGDGASLETPAPTAPATTAPEPTAPEPTAPAANPPVPTAPAPGAQPATPPASGN